MCENATLLDGEKVEVVPVGREGTPEGRGGGGGDYRCGWGLAGSLLGTVQPYGGGYGTEPTTWKS